jgi:chorismate synthase
MTDIVKAARADEDSIGGVCSVVVRNCPIGIYLYHDIYRYLFFLLWMWQILLLA